MQLGYIFFCNKTSVTECMRTKKFSCLDKPVSVAEELKINSVIFLLNDETDTLLGPFTVVEGPEDLEKGAWVSSVQENRFSENIKLGWERLHELKKATDKLPYLKDTKDCALSALQTQEILDTLKDAPLFTD